MGTDLRHTQLQEKRGSGMICLNGAAARCVQTGDKIIIMCYAQMTPEEAKENKPNVVFVMMRIKSAVLQIMKDMGVYSTWRG